LTEDQKRFIVQLTFTSGPPPQDAQQAQRQFLTELHDEGTLVAAGRFVDERGGGMSLIRADSLDAARERFGDSPLVTGGHVDWDVREWTVTVGAA
jgi:uncharacterized protein YciI